MNEDDSDKFFYSDKYYDDQYEYRHVIITKNKAKFVPKTHLMNENEWRSLGVKQSHGWQHYMIHEPEPHILLFRRALSTKPPSQLQQFQAEQLKS